MKALVAVMLLSTLAHADTATSAEPVWVSRPAQPCVYHEQWNCELWFNLDSQHDIRRMDVFFEARLGGAEVEAYAETSDGRREIWRGRRVSGTALELALPSHTERVVVTVHNHLRRRPYVSWWRVLVAPAPPVRWR